MYVNDNVPSAFLNKLLKSLGKFNQQTMELHAKNRLEYVLLPQQQAQLWQPLHIYIIKKYIYRNTNTYVYINRYTWNDIFKCYVLEAAPVALTERAAPLPKAPRMASGPTAAAVALILPAPPPDSRIMENIYI